MTINSDKCELNGAKISKLGYKISKEGISPDNNLLNKISVLDDSLLICGCLIKMSFKLIYT